MSKDKEYRYSEIFASIQGEGHYCGVPTIWLRLWGCNLSCWGFGQDNLDDPDTWVIPANDLDMSNIKTLEDLPIFHTTCDSGYSHEKNFRHLASKGTAEQIVDRLTELLTSIHNTTGSFRHENSGQEWHLAFTGGEPMMSQPAMVAIMEEFAKRENVPRFVTVETNGTRPIKEELSEFLRTKFLIREEFGGILPSNRGNPEWFWSISPKLRASGEPWDKAIRPEVIAEYMEASEAGQLKYVVDGSERTWFEVKKATDEFRKVDVGLPVWVMPVGADLEMQEVTAKDVTLDAISRGYNVAARVHTFIFGNAIGT